MNSLQELCDATRQVLVCAELAGPELEIDHLHRQADTWACAMVADLRAFRVLAEELDASVGLDSSLDWMSGERKDAMLRVLCMVNAWKAHTDRILGDNSATAERIDRDTQGLFARCRGIFDGQSDCPECEGGVIDICSLCHGVKAECATCSYGQDNICSGVSEMFDMEE